ACFRRASRRSRVRRSPARIGYGATSRGRSTRWRSESRRSRRRRAAGPRSTAPRSRTERTPRPGGRLEATPRLELGVELLQSSALPLGYVADVVGAGGGNRTRASTLGRSQAAITS